MDHSFHSETGDKHEHEKKKNAPVKWPENREEPHVSGNKAEEKPFKREDGSYLNIPAKSIPSGHHVHGHHEGMIKDFRMRFWICMAASVPVALLSPMIGHLLSYELIFPGSGYLVLAVSSFIFFWGGSPFLKGFADVLKKRKPGFTPGSEFEGAIF